MHGLINRAIQKFLTDTYGVGLWSSVAREAGIGVDGFEPMQSYPADSTEALLMSASRLLDRSRASLLEDLGHHLVSDPSSHAVRRLMRFGGTVFCEFLQTLEDMPGRGRMALSDLELPELHLNEESPDEYSLVCRGQIAGTGHVMLGLLRAMADEYGALVMLDHIGTSEGGEVIKIQVHQSGFAAGRNFDLGARLG